MSATLEDQIAEAEAEAEDEDAEPDADEEAAEEAEDEEAEDQPSGLAPIGPDEIRKAERAVDAQRKKLAGILGAGYVEHECIFCSALGFVPDVFPPGTLVQVGPTENGEPYLVQAPAELPPLQTAPDKERCPECDGEGEVLTGSKTANGAVWQCAKCQGNGWIQRARDADNALAAPGAPGVPVAAAPVPVDASMVDAWGRPGGHQHWGVPPAMIQG